MGKLSVCHPGSGPMLAAFLNRSFLFVHRQWSSVPLFLNVV